MTQRAHVLYDAQPSNATIIHPAPAASIITDTLHAGESLRSHTHNRAGRRWFDLAWTLLLPSGPHRYSTVQCRSYACRGCAFPPLFSAQSHTTRLTSRDGPGLCPSSPWTSRFRQPNLPEGIVVLERWGPRGPEGTGRSKTRRQAGLPCPSFSALRGACSWGHRVPVI